MRRRAKPSKAKVQSKRPTAPKSRKSEGSSLGDLEKRLAEALEQLQTRDRELIEAQEQQTAAAEILRVISQSPTDAQPVFDAIAHNAVRLCEATYGVVHRFNGTKIEQPIAMCNVTDEQIARYRRIFPLAASMNTALGESVLTRRTVHVEDTLTERRYTLDTEAVRVAREVLGFRTLLAVPIVNRDQALGIIGIWRQEQRPFSHKQITLVETFADQAVIAIENVRLFTETKEALEQQTATSEILRVIASSPTDTQPVFETIVRSAVLLCGAMYGSTIRFDGELMHLAAGYNYTPEVAHALHEAFPMRPSPRMMSGRAILSGDVVQVEDALEDPDYSQEVARAGGFRSMLAAPMLRDGRPIGAIVVNRGQPGRFSPTQIALLQTFADQAVIAIENVRLFKELEARTTALTRSVEQLTALGEVGRAVSSTLDLPTVLDTILTRANVLAGTDGGAIYEFESGDQTFHLRRAAGTFEDEFVAVLRANPLPLGEGVVGRAGEQREPVQIPDIRDPGMPYDSRVREAVLAAGYRALLAVPLLSEEEVIGALVVNRRIPGEFDPAIVEILRTFATQSALAIQNARLFHEIEQKSRELEAASQHKSEFLTNMSHELRTPLNAIIGFSEVLSERMFGDLNEKQDEYLKDIHASGQHLLSLINDILDLSKIEAGRMELEVTDFDLPMAIDNALTLVRERAARRSIALHTTVDERLGQIQGDERKIRQVLLNLLSNAIKFTPEGGRIDVHAVPRDGMVEVSVSDTGVGIAPEDQDAMFEEFRQVGTSDKKIEGTGLGLALSRKFIELHGGKIWVKSQIGEGSTFTFTVPVPRGE